MFYYWREYFIIINSLFLSIPLCHWSSLKLFLFFLWYCFIFLVHPLVANHLFTFWFFNQFPSVVLVKWFQFLHHCSHLIFIIPITNSILEIIWITTTNNLYKCYHILKTIPDWHLMSSFVFACSKTLLLFLLLYHLGRRLPLRIFYYILFPHLSCCII